MTETTQTKAGVSEALPEEKHPGVRCRVAMALYETTKRGREWTYVGVPRHQVASQSCEQECSRRQEHLHKECSADDHSTAEECGVRYGQREASAPEASEWMSRAAGCLGRAACFHGTACAPPLKTSLGILATTTVCKTEEIH